MSRTNSWATVVQSPRGDWNRWWQRKKKDTEVRETKNIKKLNIEVSNVGDGRVYTPELYQRKKYMRRPRATLFSFVHLVYQNNMTHPECRECRGLGSIGGLQIRLSSKGAHLKQWLARALLTPPSRNKYAFVTRLMCLVSESPTQTIVDERLLGVGCICWSTVLHEHETCAHQIVSYVLSISVPHNNTHKMHIRDAIDV